MVSIEYCRLSVTDSDLTRFLAPRLAKKGIRNLELNFLPGHLKAKAVYPLNRFGFGDIGVHLTMALTAFDAENQAIDLRITDFDLNEAGDRGLLGKMLGITVNVAKKVTGAELVKRGLEFLRGRLAFLDVDAPGLKLRVKVATLAAILKPYVNNLHPDGVELELGRLIVVQNEAPVRTEPPAPIE